MSTTHEANALECYQSNKEHIKNNIVFQLSQFGFALKCQYALCNRFQGTFPYGVELNEALIRTLQNGDNVYINVHIPNFIEAVNHFINIIYEKQLKLNFYIMGEPAIDEEVVYILLYYTNNMYLQNNTFEHPKIHSMPIGIRDGEEVFSAHQHFSQTFLLNESLQSREKQYLCYMCFKDSHSERLRCEEILGEKEFVLNLIKNEYPPQLSIHCWKVPVELNYKCTHESHYTLSPTGLGQATHRFFEAIYLDSIPIVKRTNTPFDKLYNVFPCLIVEDWDEVTRELLESNLEDYSNELKEFKEKYPNLYTTLEGIDELLLQT
jgi:hypothetical protein